MIQMMFAEINIIDIFERFGVSLSFLVFMLWTTYKGFGWLGSNILLPLHQRHMLFIDRLESSINEVTKVQTESMRILAEVLNHTKILRKDSKND
jgi:hypothetical protein